MVVVGVLPLLGAFAYLLLGEVNIGRWRVARQRAVLASMPPRAEAVDGNATGRVATVPDHHRHLFDLGHSISGFVPVGGNSAHLLPDSNATIDAMVGDIDAASDHVH